MIYVRCNNIDCYHNKRKFKVKPEDYEEEYLICPLCGELTLNEYKEVI
jgi:hypothetical protein